MQIDLAKIFGDDRLRYDLAARAEAIKKVLEGIEASTFELKKAVLKGRPDEVRTHADRVAEGVAILRELMYGLD